MTDSPQRPGALNWAMLLALGMIWGASFLSVRIALEGFGPFTVAAGRISIAALILLVHVRLTGRSLPPASLRLWAHVAGFALFSNALPFSLLSWAQQIVPSAFAGVTMAAVPLLVLPLAHLFVPGERLTPVKAAGFLCGFSGVVLLIGPGEIARAGLGGDVVARLACIAAAGCYAIGSIVTRTAPPTGQVGFSAAALALAAVVMVPLALALEGLPPAVPDPAALAALAYLAVAPTALATLMLVHIIRSAGPSFLSLVNYQVPVWAALFGALALGEALPANLLTALGLILGGLALAQAGLSLQRRAAVRRGRR